jgi:XTP/dITP diphosphohydrolase
MFLIYFIIILNEYNNYINIKFPKMVTTVESPVFVTSNVNKVKEFEKILGIKLENKSLELDEIQSTDVSEVTLHKVKQAYELLKKPVIVEDTGLYIDDINGFPGALIKFYMRDVGCAGICAYHQLSQARAETVIGYHNGETVQLFKGCIKGKISTRPIGSNGFGWDCIFIPEKQHKTFAEMTDIEKNKHSMRCIALNKFKSGLFNDSKRD